MKAMITLILIAAMGVAVADSYRAGKNAYAPTYRPLTGDAFTRAHPELPFASNPGDRYYDTTVERNHKHRRDDYWLRNKDTKRRHGWRDNASFRPNPRPGSEIR